MIAPTTLGYAVLLYALLTSSAALRLGWLVLGDSPGHWSDFVDVALWLGFIVGAVGLILDRAWARVVTFIASLGLAVSAGAWVVAWGVSGTVPAGLSSLLSLLVAVAIVFVLMKLPPPAARAAPDRRLGSSIRRLDLAYGSLTLCVVVGWLVEAGVRWIPHDPGQALFMLLWVPVMFLALFCIGAAVIVSILEWRHWPLPVMTATLGSMMLLLFVFDARGGGNHEVPLLAYAAGTVLVLALSIRWFVYDRRRAAPAK